MTKKEWQLEHLPQPPPVPDGPDRDSALLASSKVPTHSDLDIEADDAPSPKYPKSVFFIVTNEFCERFTFYGLRTILSLYFISSLGYSQDTATVMYHAFVMLCYFFPLIGAVIADSWLGKFKTIFYLSIIYSAGSILLSLSSGHFLSKDEHQSGGLEEPLSLLGLLLIAIGTGGIKPCVSSFGGDQFKLPEQRLQLAQFFSIFYFAINAGSLISTFVTPIFRQDIKCFGQDSCYPLAFGVPAVIMVVSLVVFVAGRALYKVNPPQGNVLVRVCACIASAISGKRKRTDSAPNMRWIDYADQSKYEKDLRDDVLIVLKVLALFLPLPIFWALFDQQGSRWTFQAINMNGRIGSYVIKPDQMQVVNPVLILLFLPLMEAFFYPCLARLHLLRKPLQRMVAGGVLASVSFFVSAILERQLEMSYPFPLSADLAQIRMFNVGPCPLNITTESFSPVYLHEFDMHAELALKAISETPLKLSVSGESACVKAPGEFDITLKPESAQSVFLFNDNGVVTLGEASTTDTVTKTSEIDPVVRFVYSFSDVQIHTIKLRNAEKTVLNFSTAGVKFNASEEFKGILIDSYSIEVDNKVVLTDVFLDVSGTYSVLINETSAKVVKVREPNQIGILWQLPQYIIITVAEVMFSVTGLEFSFTQAPVSMKSVLTSAWLLTVAVGNLIVMVIAEAKLFESHVWEFVLFASLMLADMAIFIILAMRYKYRDDAVNANASEDVTMETTTNGLTGGNDKKK